ncbi:DUF222 domain-containing protein [Georgenia sp. M64]|uniref:HNH endonuclease signature motif containing protein n=1 Tax=Georgenia sp. M64 TaxID=3120520 RepID=UPI0030E582E0
MSTDGAASVPSRPGAASTGPGTSPSSAASSAASVPVLSLSVGLARVVAEVAAVLEVDVLGAAGQEVLDAVTAVEGLRRQVEALAGRVLSAVDAHGLWATDGARSLPAWYRARTGRTDVTARVEVARTRALRDHLPATAAALAAGRVGPDHAAALVRHALTTATLRERLADPDTGEDFLLAHAQDMDASAFTHLVRAWAIRADPAAADHRYRAETDREELYLSRTTGGWSIKGWLSETSGEVLNTALTARTGTPAQSDPATPAQRRAGALTGIARLALDSGTLRPHARTRPHLAVTVPFDTLHRLATSPDPRCAGGAEGAGSAFFAPTAPTALAGLAGLAGCGCGQGGCGTVISTDYDTTAMIGADPATLADGTPLPHALLARLACSSGIHRVVFGPDSQPLDVGREERLYTTAQTRAIIARDRHCQYPDCTAPPGEGEIHHSLWWYAHHGPTDTNKGILLCWHHHDHVHARRITITREHHRWRFHRHDNTEILPTTHHLAA